jgi:hypothetical protein
VRLAQTLDDFQQSAETGLSKLAGLRYISDTLTAAGLLRSAPLTSRKQGKSATE